MSMSIPATGMSRSSAIASGSATSAAKPSVLGTVIDVEHRSRTIIGIMPQRFLWRGADLYLPIPVNSDADREGPGRYALVGRVRPGVTSAQASTALQPLYEDFRKATPAAYPDRMRVGLMPFAQMFASGLDDVLDLLLGAVVLLLLIACANVSSLLLARAVARDREFAVRSALGASRWRLARAAFTESLALALIALPVALAFAYASLQIILRIVPTETIPDEAVVALNLPVLAAALAVACLTILVFGMAPAWRSARPQWNSAAQGSARSSSGRAQQRLLGGFVVTEIALSLALLTLAGLMIRSLVALESVPISFDADHTLVAGFPLAADRYPNADTQDHFYSQLLDRVRQLPGVHAATIDGSWPLLDANGMRVQIQGQPIDQRYNALHLVDPSFLAVSGRTLLAGHFIDQREIDQHAQEMVVSEGFARRYLSGTVLGRIVHLPQFRPDRQHPLTSDAFTIVGVIKDVPVFATYLEDFPEMFVPYSVAPQATGVLLVKTATPAESLVEPLRRTVSDIDKEVPVTDAVSLRQLLDMYGYAGPRFALVLFSTFAAAAMLLTLVGIYGDARLCHLAAHKVDRHPHRARSAPAARHLDGRPPGRHPCGHRRRRRSAARSRCRPLRTKRAHPHLAARSAHAASPPSACCRCWPSPARCCRRAAPPPSTPPKPCARSKRLALEEKCSEGKLDPQLRTQPVLHVTPTVLVLECGIIFE